MGLIKLTFYITIFISSSLIGFLHGERFNTRARTLQDLGYCIRILENEILVGNTPLTDALFNTHRKGRGPIANVFYCIRRDLIEEEREDIYISFESVKDMLKENYSLKEKDIETILYLGKILGKSNRKDQEKNFTFILNEIENNFIEANAESGIYGKLYRSLGMLFGVAIIILIT